MPDNVPSRLSETSDGIMALLNTVASSAPMVASAKDNSTSGSEVDRDRERRAKVRTAADTSSTEKPAIHGLRGSPASAMAPSTGARIGGDQLGDAGGVGPQRRAAAPGRP